MFECKNARCKFKEKMCVTPGKGRIEEEARACMAYLQRVSGVTEEYPNSQKIETLGFTIHNDYQFIAFFNIQFCLTCGHSF